MTEPVVIVVVVVAAAVMAIGHDNIPWISNDNFVFVVVVVVPVCSGSSLGTKE
jgi:hypothetical protein